MKLSAWSPALYWWVAEYMPIGKDTTQMNRMAAKETTKERKMRSPISWLTGRS